MLKKQIIPIVRAFQSALPRGERQRSDKVFVRIYQFQSALPRGERRVSDFSVCQHDRYFNPRSREGSDIFPFSFPKILIIISIRAPARGATTFRSPFFSISWYFNPRSREGSDDRSTGHITITGDFNPRSREGSDDQETEWE